MSRLKSRQRSWTASLRRVATQHELVRALHASLEPRHIARLLVDHLAEVMPLTCWTVVAPDLDDQLVILADSGLTADLVPALHGVAFWVTRHHHELLSGNLKDDERLRSGPRAAAVAFPLRGREQIAGALVGFDRGVSKDAPAPGRALMRALDTLLAPAALALDASLLLKRVEALSVTDDLTRLYNARYLNLTLRRETRLAARSRRPLSLLFVDLDGFKSINDNHGHLAGSRALVEAAAIMRGSARETDIVARFGGDEFALVLPDTGTPGALQVAERVRDRLARHAFLAAEGLNVHLTASVGVATLPGMAATADELVQAADSAMYRVKVHGKNGILAASSR